jgi:hypothetical protein
MPAARQELATRVVGHTLYAVGGDDGNNPLDTVDAYSKI